MPASSTDVCNQALAHLGERPISSLDDDTKAGRACKLHYQPVRDEVLRSHRWNFATTRATLSQLEDAPVFGWSYQYQLPADCLRVSEINDTEAGDRYTDEWVIEGRKILTNAETLNLVYVKQVEDTSEFDSLFTQALAVKLAMKLSEAIRGTTGKTAELAEMYARLTGPEARRTDANEARRRKGLIDVSSRFVLARGGTLTN